MFLCFICKNTIKKCEHDKRKSRCKDCGGGSLCNTEGFEADVSSGTDSGASSGTDSGASLGTDSDDSDIPDYEVSFINKCNSKDTSILPYTALDFFDVPFFVTNDTKEIVKSGITTYKYLPYGNFDDAIPYLTRRIYENPKILYYLLK